MGITQDTIYKAIDELSAIASAGLYYTKDGYHKERYERILRIALRLLSGFEERPFGGLALEFQEDNWLHMSPSAGAKPLLFRQERSCSSNDEIMVYGLSRVDG